jgi:hypothetical protein
VAVLQQHMQPHLTIDLCAPCLVEWSDPSYVQASVLLVLL